MKRAARAAALAGFLACVSIVVGPFRAGVGTADGPVYEEGGELRASDLLPRELLRGPHHAVAEEVTGDGFVPTYTVETAQGTFTARGEAMLRARIAEAAAVARLAEAADSDAFRDAAAEAPPLPFVSGGWTWKPDPSAAAPGLPAGALAGGPWADGATSAEAAASPVLLGFQERRRELARRLGVDPYARNAPLQRELDRHAWVSFSTGTPLGIEGGDADEAAARAHSERVERLLEHFSAGDLERMNRLELVAMGVPEELREEFIDNPSYSPRNATALVGALADLEGTEDRVTFIQAAVGADSEEAAESFQQVAQMLRQHNAQGGGLQKLLQVDGQVAAFTKDGTLVVPVMADHAVWTERVEGFAESIARAAGESPETARARLLVSGSVSSRALDEIQERGIEVTEGALGADTGESGEPTDPTEP